LADTIITDIFALAKNKQQSAATEPPQIADKEVKEEIIEKPNVLSISVDKLIPYDHNPFHLYDGERLTQLIESVRENGIITPLIVRPMGGDFQILAGHNRHNAACIVGFETVPCLVRYVDDTEALEIVLESNFTQRSITDMLPSELAKSLQMQVELFKTCGKRTDLVSQMQQLMEDKYGEEETVEDENSTSGHGDRRLKNDSVITLSESTRRRYMRLNLLQEDLLALVDNGFISVLCGVELSYLRVFEQELLVAFLEENTAEINKKKATRLRELSRENALNALKIKTVLSERETKKEFALKITKPSQAIKSLFPAGTKPKTIESTIVTALKFYFENNPKERHHETE